MMKRFSVLFMAGLLALCASAQKRTTMLTMFKQNKPATITLNDGRIVKSPHSNVFLKNAALLYLQGTDIKEARMDIISSVDFGERKFINIDNRLAYFVDSVRGNSLYCIELIDMDSYKRNLKNNVNITHIDLSSDHIDAFTNDTNEDNDFLLPVFKHFYYLLDGKIIEAHDRDLWQALDKERYRLFKTAISAPDFSWSDPESLMNILRLISK